MSVRSAKILFQKRTRSFVASSITTASTTSWQNTASVLPQKQLHKKHQQIGLHRASFSFTSLSSRPNHLSTRATEEKVSTNAVEKNDEIVVHERPRWLKQMSRKAKQNLPLDSQKVYRYLKLEQFTEDELDERFQIIATSDGTAEATIVNITKDVCGSGEDNNLSSSLSKKEIFAFDRDKLRSYMMRHVRDSEDNIESTTISSPATDESDFLRNDYVEAETVQFWNFLKENRKKRIYDNKEIITKNEFIACLLESAAALDTKRLGPLTFGMIGLGLSIGIATPALPFLIQELGLSTGEYGMIVSAVMLAKLVGNIPFSVLVERDGRKPYLVYSMIIMSVGVGGIGLASSFGELYCFRLITGLGMAAFMCSAIMSAADLSTPLNRASTLAPLMTGIMAGMSIGPALGGVLIDQIGISNTFYFIGTTYLASAAFFNFFFDETMHQARQKFPWQNYVQQHNDDDKNKNNNKTPIKKEFQDALGQWKPLFLEAPVRQVCLMNMYFNMAMMGGQATLLPLILIDPNGLAMTATGIGKVFMGMSITQVACTSLFAKVTDKIGHVPGIITGCTLISAGMFGLPLCDPNQIEQMALVLGLWAAGSSLLIVSPTAHVSNIVDDSKRTQALSLMRTTGDAGAFIGASAIGLLASYSGGTDAALQSSSLMLASATSWYIVRNVLSAKMSNKAK